MIRNLKNDFKWIFFYSIILFAFIFASSFMIHYFTQINTKKYFSFNSIFEKILLVVIIAPILETLIFQFLIIYLLQEYFPENKYLAITISAIAFGISHYYNIYIIVDMFFVGFFLAQIFFKYKEKNNYFYATIVVIIIHSLTNTYITIIKNL